MSPCPRNIAPPSNKHSSIRIIHCHCTTRWCRPEVTCTPCTPMFSISSVKTPGSDSEQTKNSSEEAEAAQWQRRDHMQLTLPIVVHDSPWPAISAGVHTCNCDACNSKRNLPTETRKKNTGFRSPTLGFRRRLTFSSSAKLEDFSDTKSFTCTLHLHKSGSPYPGRETELSVEDQYV